MNQKEIPEVYALLGGTNAWKGAGYPMEGSGPVQIMTPQNAAPAAEKPAP